MKDFYQSLNSVSRAIWFRVHGTSIEFYKEAAEQGSVEALNALGDIYCEESACPTALEYYRKAAALGNSDAMYRIAKIYACGGDGIQADGTKALKWFEKAATYGNCKAMLIIGESYCADKELHETTNKVWIDNVFIKSKPDLPKAVSWFKKAEASCHGNQDGLAELYYEIASAIFRQSKNPDAHNYAEKYLKKSAESGNKSAMLDLADHYYYRKDCEEEAIKWCKNAFGHADGDGMLNILERLHKARERLHKAKIELMEKDEEIEELHSYIEMLQMEIANQREMMKLLNDKNAVH